MSIKTTWAKHTWARPSAVFLKATRVVNELGEKLREETDLPYWTVVYDDGDIHIQRDQNRIKIDVDGKPVFEYQYLGIPGKPDRYNFGPWVRELYDIAAELDSKAARGRDVRFRDM